PGGSRVNHSRCSGVFPPPPGGFGQQCTQTKRCVPSGSSAGTTGKTTTSLRPQFGHSLNLTAGAGALRSGFGVSGLSDRVGIGHLAHGDRQGENAQLSVSKFSGWMEQRWARGKGGDSSQEPPTTESKSFVRRAVALPTFPLTSAMSASPARPITPQFAAQ